jgi:hypothetical protein
MTGVLAGLLVPGASCRAAPEPALPAPPNAGEPVRGVTISTPTYGPEWGSRQMAQTLDRLVALGATWFAYHPYARISKQGAVGRSAGEALPDWVTAPIAMARDRGLRVMVKPHLAHWGSGFSWRGAIRFDAPEAEKRFFAEYRAWILQLARACSEADAFSVGTELDGTTHSESAWRGVIAAVREQTDAYLTFASNWDAYERIAFWDALDCIGVQAYFPLVSDDDVPEGALPTEEQLEAGWDRVLARVGSYAASLDRPVVFTELGYDASTRAAHEPWASGHGSPELQERALRVALRKVEADPTVVGSFLWKWFPGEVQRGDFRMSRPELQAIIRDAWST